MEKKGRWCKLLFPTAQEIYVMSRKRPVDFFNEESDKEEFLRFVISPDDQLFLTENTDTEEEEECNRWHNERLLFYMIKKASNFTAFVFHLVPKTKVYLLV